MNARCSEMQTRAILLYLSQVLIIQHPQTDKLYILSPSTWNFMEIFGNIWNYLELFENIWNYLEIFGSTGNFWKYLEINVEVEVGVHYISSRITPRIYKLKETIYVYLNQAQENFSKFSLRIILLSAN